MKALRLFSTALARYWKRTNTHSVSDARLRWLLIVLKTDFTSGHFSEAILRNLLGSFLRNASKIE